MFQDIHPHRLDLSYSNAAAGEGDYAVLLRAGRVLVVPDGDGRRLPYVSEVAEQGKGAGDLVRLFGVDGRGVYLSLDESEREAGGAGEFLEPGKFRGFIPSWMGFVGVTAGHLGLWYRANRFCGGCGERMRAKADERALECQGCGTVVYPRISPAVIVGVVDGDRIVLTRYNRPGSRLTALIAGFMEVGESFEDTVRREVMEEIGLRVCNIRYYGSQPWAFSGSVLAGFYADVDGEPTIRMDEVELAEARWVDRTEIGDVDTMSLTGTMVDVFRRDAHPK